MSGCCGPSPVITSLPSAPRTDVESSPLLCDVLPDGTVAGQALVEAIYDTTSGERVGTRIVDPATGADYPVQGTLQPCPAPEQCSCETVLLCDQPPGGDEVIQGLDVSDGTLANGVAWQVTGSQDAPDASDRATEDGAWWRAGIFPNQSVGPTTWTFSRPAEVEFSVFLMWTAYEDTVGGNRAQLPPGAEPISLPPGYFYDPATNIVSVDDTRAGDCEGLAHPTQAVSARFRLPGPVESFTLLYLGERSTASPCGEFGNWFFGAVHVDPVPVPFLRHICRTCTGTATVTDTTLDGVTTYDASTGTVGVCGPTSGETASGRQIVERCACDDVNGDGSVINRYVELWSVDPDGEEEPTLLGAWLDGDFTMPYEPVSPVDCPAAGPEEVAAPIVLGHICYDDGTGTVRTAAVVRCAGCDDTTVRYVDVETGAEVTAPTAVPCPADPGCASPTTPVTTVGLCLADGTPIAVTVVRDCDGAITSEGWLNLTTGAFTAGAVPVGTVACGDARSIQVSGTFCAVDDTTGDVVALVLVEYTYDDTGAIASVRLVDATTGATYVPPAGVTVTVCPAGVEQPEQDAVTLCHTATDGTVTTFVRDYRRDETGAITGHSDYLLDGTAYVPPADGTVAPCCCKERPIVCYAASGEGDACTDGELQTLPPINPVISSSAVEANPNALTVSGLSAGYDGSTDTWTTTTVDASGAATGLVLRYTFGAPTDLGSLELLNQYGSNTSDNDGIGSATLTVYDTGGNQLWQGALTGGNGGAAKVTTFGEVLHGAASFTLSNIARIAGTSLSQIGWREIRPLGPYRALITWDCPGETLSAEVEGALAGITYDGTNIVQTNGPHAFTFSSSTGAFEATLDTTNPAAWSTLEVSDTAPTAVLSGNASLSLAVTAAALNSLAVGWLNDDGSVTDLDTGEVVTDPRIVPCVAPEEPDHIVTSHIVELCDGGTSFLRHVRVTRDGQVLITNTGLDGRTAYAVTDEASVTLGACQRERLGEVCAEMGPLLAPSALAGFIEQDGCLVTQGQANPTATYTGSVDSIELTEDAGVAGGRAFRLVLNGVTTLTSTDFTPAIPAFPTAVSEYSGTATVGGITVTAELVSGGLARNGTAFGLAGRMRFTFDQTLDSVQITTGSWPDDPANRICDVVILPSTAPDPQPLTAFLETDQSVTYYAADGSQVDAPVLLPSTECAASPCQDCETLILCDAAGDDPATIRGLNVSSGTLPNGVAWSATGTGTAPDLPATSKVDNADGAWWGASESFPLASVTPYTFTYDSPSVVEFSVYMAFSPGAAEPDDNCTQLPAGVEVVDLPVGYVFDPVTSQVCVTADQDPAGVCTDIGNPNRASSARFRTNGPVSTMTVRFLGVRRAVCGSFQTFRVGAFDVTPVGQFMRRICRDCDGATVSITDTLLDGSTPYLPRGGVVVCNPEPACCQPVQVCVTPRESGVVQFVSNPQHLDNGTVADTWTWAPASGNPNTVTTWYPMYNKTFGGAWSATDAPTKDDGTTNSPTAFWVCPHPDARITNTGQPGEGPTLLNPGNWWARAAFNLPAAADPDSIKVEITVLNADQVPVRYRLNSGPWIAGGGPYNGARYTQPPQSVSGAQAGSNFLYFEVNENASVPAGSNGAGVMAHFILTYEIAGQASWTQMVCCDGDTWYLDNSGNRYESLPDGYAIIPCSQNTPVTLCDDNGAFIRWVADLAGEVTVKDTDLNGGDYSPVGVVRNCAGDGTGTASSGLQILERCNCSDEDGDGIAETRYVELWSVDPEGVSAPLLVGTYVDGDFTMPLTPAAPMDCPAGDSSAVTVLTGARSVTGTAPQDLAAEFPGLQSVSLLVSSGSVLATLTDGSAVPIPAGANVTWSVARDEDAALGAASFAGADAGTAYLLLWTRV